MVLSVDYPIRILPQCFIESDRYHMTFDWPPTTPNFNTKGLPQAHNVIEHASERTPRIVRICRCWQSKKFPYCDDSHKLLMEHGDSVGPFVARLDALYPENATAGKLKQSGAFPVAPTKAGVVFTRVRSANGPAAITLAVAAIATAAILVWEPGVSYLST